MPELDVDPDVVVVRASTPASGNALRQTQIGSSSSLSPANCVVSKPYVELVFETQILVGVLRKLTHSRSVH